MEQSYAQSDSMGIDVITAEVDALFSSIEFADQA